MSKKFKKNFIKKIHIYSLYYKFTKYENKFKINTDINTKLYEITFDKIIKMFVCSTRKITYINKKKKYIQSVCTSINKIKYRNRYFLKFLKFFFFKKNCFSNLKNFIYFEFNNKNLFKKVYTKLIIKSLK